ncbi:MAG: formylglycine-generating enzyme family protein, partial [Gemmataceae bacterium]
HGNVWEWCEDWIGNYQGSVVIDPKGPDMGVGRVLRGGSVGIRGSSVRSSSRDNDLQAFRGNYGGFRLVRTP